MTGWSMCVTGNDRVQVFQPDGTPLLMWGGPGTAPGEFNHPSGAVLDAAGNVYVLDKDNARVQKFGAATTPARRATLGALKRRYR